MKKNFFKKMSVVLALAMTVATVAPAATTASAAAAPVFKSKSVNLKVGQTKNYNMDNVTPWSVKKFVTGNKKVATVAKSGKTAKVTGVGEGKTTLRADLKAYKSKRDLQVRVPVTVVPDKAEIKSVTQNTTTKFTVAFSAALEEVKVADFAMVRDNDNVVIPVKGVELSTDKKAVTLETYNELKDGKVYTVTFDSKSAKMTATDGTPAAVAITPATIKAGSDADIYAQTLDTNGVVLTQDKYGSTSTGVVFSVESILGGGYMSGQKLYLNAVGDKATFKVEYHSYTYNDDGTEKIALSGTFDVTAVEDSSYLDAFDYSIGGTEFKEGEKSVAVGDASASVYFQIKDNSGNKVTGKGYALESSDTSKFIISGNTDGATIVPVGAGSAYIIVKDGNNIIKTLPVTVSAARVATNISISKTNIVVAKDMGEAALGEKVKATVKDQYGKTMTASITAIDFKSNTGTDVLSGAEKDDMNTDEVTIYDAKVAGKGVYDVKIRTLLDGKDYTRTLSVEVKDVDAESVDGYRLIANDVDTTVKADNETAQTVNVKVAEVKKGVVTGYAEAATISAVAVVRDSLGKTINSDFYLSESGTINATGDLATVTASALASSTITKNLSAGTYTIGATIDGKYLSTTFTVKDEQKQPTFTVNKTNVGDINTLSGLFGNKNANMPVTVKYDGADDTTVGTVVAKNANDFRITGKFAFVGTVVVEITIPGTSTKVKFDLAVNQTFTSNNNW